MKRSLFWGIVVVVIFILMLAACNLPEASQSPTSRMNEIQTEAALQVTPVFKTPTIVSTATQKETQIPSTPTAYPTFHPELAMSMTPAQPEICPSIKSDFVFSDKELAFIKTDFGLFVTNALNSGASFEQILLKLFPNDAGKRQSYMQDLTSDGVPEMILPHDHVVSVYQCHEGGYRSILEYDTVEWSPDAGKYKIDINKNGIPELLITFQTNSNNNNAYDLLEWNGLDMKPILLVDHGTNSRSTSRIANGVSWNINQSVWVENHWVLSLGDTTGDFILRDLDGNGFSEIVFDDYGPGNKMAFYESGPWLYQRLVFTWNGESFLFSDYQIDVPYYRYQALQEADRAFLMRDYDQASILYDKVVGSTVLEWYSLDRKKYFWDVYSAKQAGKDPAQVPYPYFRADEYQYLSAYARFRKVVLLLAEGKQADAYFTYQLLDQIYTEQNPGFWHAEMGRIYWKAVKEGMSLTEACQLVIKYVEQNPKLLEALGDQWHGQQSHIYVASDVCPLDEMDVELLSGNP
jgi:hypothetical protein